jgi:uncharacterized protein (DUF58 family)
VPTSEGTATAFLAGFFFLLATNLMAGWLFFLVAFLVALLAVGLASAAAGARAVRVTLAASKVRTVEGGEVALPVILEGVAGARFLRIGAGVGERRGEVFVGRIRRGQRQPLMLRFPAPARGAHALERVEIISPGLVGLFRVRRSVPVRGEVLVRPRFQRLAALPAGSGAEEEGVPAGGRRGEELVGTREYLPGDPARHIHWRSSRRHRRLIVKEFDDPSTPVAAIVIDADAAQHREAFDRAVRGAASLAHTAIEGGLDVAVAAVDGRGPMMTRGNWDQIWDALAGLRADGPPLPEAMARLGALLPPGRMPLIVTAGARGAGRGAIVIGPEGAETPWEFDAEGGVRRRWRG